MAEISYTTGDATSPTAAGNKIICHICNDVGGWGRGFVLAISKRWAGPEGRYRQWFELRDGNDFGFGAVQFVQVELELWVANMVAQRDVRARDGRPPIRYDAVESCLGKVADFSEEQNAGVHMPRIGCGLAGGSWAEIEPIVKRTLVDRGISVTVYDFK